jgi:hypothetical protein
MAELSVSINVRVMTERLGGIELKSGFTSSENASYAQSKFLRIEVRSPLEVLVSLEFPAQSARQLSDLMPASAMKEARTQGIDLEKIAAEAAASQFAPQTLFSWASGDRNYKVWLE